jgi:hypothetical protein
MEGIQSIKIKKETFTIGENLTVRLGDNYDGRWDKTTANVEITGFGAGEAEPQFWARILEDTGNPAYIAGDSCAFEYVDIID